MRLWRDSLRMQRRAGHDVEVPLSQLPTNDWQRIFSRGVGSGRGLSSYARSIALPFHTERPTGVVGVTAGSLDDPSWFQPQMDIFMSDAQPWDQMDPAMPKFEEYPPSAKE
jgi:hypothetical protein